MSKSGKRDFGPRRKMSPKLRIAMNGEFSVNAVRAENSGSICVTAKKALKGFNRQLTMDAVPPAADEVVVKPKLKRLSKIASKITASLFVEGTNELSKPQTFTGETARRGNLATIEVPLNKLDGLANLKEIKWMGLGEQLQAPNPLEGGTIGTKIGYDRVVPQSNLHKKGEEVLIGIIDVGGFDFAHPDFTYTYNKDLGKIKTRFLKIWDQGGQSRSSPAANGGQFNYGSELLQKDLNKAIEEAPKIGVSATDLEPQSQMSIGSHGTHVASIAAGNKGIAPKATIVGVLIDLPEEDVDRRLSFFDTTRLVHAVEYLLDVADKEKKPISINISLGTNGHAHDGTAPVSRWIDSALARPGRAVCGAAGNAGQERPLQEGDIGFVMGRIHTSGRIAAKGLTQDIEWHVVGNTIADLSENELEIWYEPQDRFAISIQPPGLGWIGPIQPREFIENCQLPDQTFLSVYNELYHPANGANYISIYLSPFFGQNNMVGVRAGMWKVRIHGLDIRDGRYHGWIERDDPRRLNLPGDVDAWLFPSFFSVNSNVDNSSINTLASGRHVIAVGNLNQPSDSINISSSQGPTRDGRNKPEVVAPGTKIVAAKGFAGEKDLWTAKTGTSMASPYVTGVVGLMLNVNDDLTASQINGIIRRTAWPLPGDNYNWANDSGFGVIDPEACLLEAEVLNERSDKTK